MTGRSKPSSFSEPLLGASYVTLIGALETGGSMRVVSAVEALESNGKDGRMETAQFPNHGELSPTTEVILLADKMYKREELEHRLWERRGFLKRLARSDEAA